MTNERRIEIEKLIVAKTVDVLLGAGCNLSVYDGENFTVKRSTDREAVIAALGTTDQDSLTVRKDGQVFVGVVAFVYGNDGYDVICDNTASLEEMLEPVTAYASSFEDE
jgi:hypothetical protein